MLGLLLKLAQRAAPIAQKASQRVSERVAPVVQRATTSLQNFFRPAQKTIQKAAPVIQRAAPPLQRVATTAQRILPKAVKPTLIGGGIAGGNWGLQQLLRAPMAQLPQQPSGTPQYDIVPDGGGGGGGFDGGGSGGGEYVESPEEKAERLKEEGLQTVLDQVLGAFNSGQLDTNNPFAFDEALAQNSLTQLYAPYYAQTFADFMRGVRTRGARGKEDLLRLQQELGAEGEATTGRQRRLLELGQEQVGEQYAQRGLLESGARQRAQGLLGIEHGQQLQNYLHGLTARREGATEGLRRTLEDIAIEQTQKERELGRSQEFDVASGLESARQRAMTGATTLEAIGAQPGENLQDFLKRRQGIFRQFTNI